MDEKNFANSLVMTGGGTGGHYFPAIAIAEGARIRWPKRRIIFVGSKLGIEGWLLQESSWLYLLLDVEGFIGRSPIKIIKSVWKLFIAWKHLRNIWIKHRPWAVIGTGGYGSAPALLAARSLRIPFFLHESNAIPGSLIKALAPKAAEVWCGMEAAVAHMPMAQCIVAGTPIRSAFLRKFNSLNFNHSKPYLRLLILGGSGGAKVLNEAILAIAPIILERFPNWEIVHQVGRSNFSNFTSIAIHDRYRIVPFLDNMDIEMESADLIVTRSGASTCAELKACGRPALMIPMPNSAGNHQVMNAQAMVNEMRALMLCQTSDFDSNLLDKTSQIMSDHKCLLELSNQEINRAVDICLDRLQMKLG